MIKYNNSSEFFAVVIQPHMGFLISDHAFSLNASTSPPTHFEEFIWLYREDVALIFCVVSWEINAISVGEYRNGMARPLMLLHKCFSKRNLDVSPFKLEKIAKALKEHSPEVLLGRVPKDCLPANR